MVYRILVKQVEWFAEFLPGYEKKGYTDNSSRRNELGKTVSEKLLKEKSYRKNKVIERKLLHKIIGGI